MNGGNGGVTQNAWGGVGDFLSGIFGAARDVLVARTQNEGVADQARIIQTRDQEIMKIVTIGMVLLAAVVIFRRAA